MTPPASATTDPGTVLAPIDVLPGAREADGGHDTRIITVVSIAHGCSHFFQLILAPLFIWIKPELGLSYAELGLLMTTFFVVSGFGQAAAGFVVDRVGAVPVLVASLGLLTLAAVVLALSPGYVGLLAGSAIAGIGNASFHPVDYSILNSRVRPSRLGRAYAVHGIAGNLGWALAPVFLVSIAQTSTWRMAIASAALLAAAILTLVWVSRDLLAGVPEPAASPARTEGHGHGAAGARAAPMPGSTFGFLALPAVWLSFLFFFVMAIAFGAIQSFAPEAARVLHDVDPHWVALCLTLYMLAGAGGMIVGGYLVTDPARAESVITAGYAASVLTALVLALAPVPAWSVPALFAVMGFGTAIAHPSRDLLVRRAAPPGATGRVYGTVYSGLDAGMAIGPAAFGWMMDRGWPAGVFVGIAVFQGLLIVNALKIGRQSPAEPAPA